MVLCWCLAPCQAKTSSTKVTTRLPTYDLFSCYPRAYRLRLLPQAADDEDPILHGACVCSSVRLHGCWAAWLPVTWVPMTSLQDQVSSFRGPLATNILKGARARPLNPLRAGCLSAHALICLPTHRRTDWSSRNWCSSGHALPLSLSLTQGPFSSNAQTQPMTPLWTSSSSSDRNRKVYSSKSRASHLASTSPEEDGRAETSNSARCMLRTPVQAMSCRRQGE